MKILSAIQIREADQFTIANEPIASIDLMERASEAFVTKFLGLHPEKRKVLVFCGTGNNGGDGLAVSRLLLGRGWDVSTFVVGDIEKGSDDFKINLEKISSYHVIQNESDFPGITSPSILIDGLFGSGLSCELDGLYAELISFLNEQEAQRVAIDIASGLFSEKPISKKAVIFKADFTISFQVPKLAFFLPDCDMYVGEWRVVDIGLDISFIKKQPTEYCVSTSSEMVDLLPIRSRFTHKSKVGRLMIVAGSKGKMGAAVLCARAAFKSGAGLINVHSPSCGIEILQISIPEAMVSADVGADQIESIPSSDDTIALGPGLGTESKTVKGLTGFLKQQTKPIVVDADGINILAENRDLLASLPSESILTPHPGEFRRLVGQWTDDYDKLHKLKAFCIEHKLNVVLKGAYSAVCDSNGVIQFNPTGNPGLATAGSGDVLTGVVSALLSQGLKPIDALKLGVYIHGLAGDEAVREMQSPWLQASDIIDCLPKAISSLISS